MSIARLAKRRFSKGRRKVSHRPLVEILEGRLAPATHTWTGASMTSNNWSDAGNWSGGAPSTSESSINLIFPNAAQLTSNNDITGLTVASIQFSQITGQYDLTGNAITLAGDTTISDHASTPGGAADTIDFTLNQQPVRFGTFAFFDHVYDVASS